MDSLRLHSGELFVCLFTQLKLFWCSYSGSLSIYFLFYSLSFYMLFLLPFTESFRRREMLRACWALLYVGSVGTCSFFATEKVHFSKRRKNLFEEVLLKLREQYNNSWSNLFRPNSTGIHINVYLFFSDENFERLPQFQRAQRIRYAHFCRLSLHT